MRIFQNKALILKALIVLAFVVMSIVFSSISYGDYKHLKAEIIGVTDDESVSTIDIKIRVGEELDLVNYLDEAKSAVNIKEFGGVNGYYEIEEGLTYFNTSKEVVEINMTKLTAIKSGFTRLSYNYIYYTSMQGNVFYFKNTIMERIVLFEINVIVLDSEDEYIPVYTYSDLGEEYRTYVLMNDIEIDESDRVLTQFNGVLLNPEGYVINLNKELLYYFAYSNQGYIEGLIYNAIINNVFERKMEISYLMSDNYGIITDCEFNIEIVTNADIWLIGVKENRYYIKDNKYTIDITLLDEAKVKVGNENNYSNVIDRYVDNNMQINWNEYIPSLAINLHKLTASNTIRVKLQEGEED